MSRCDAIVHGGFVVTSSSVKRLDIAIEEGRISALEPEISRPAKEHIAADGLYVFPGLVDVHVHAGAPGHSGREGFSAYSGALAAGGVTCFFDMPFHTSPAAIDAEAFHAKRAQAVSLVDFGLWGGVVPGKLDQLEPMAQMGAVGFKAAMCAPGLDASPTVDEATLREAMSIAARIGIVVAVHAESEAITAGLTRRALSEGRLTFRDYCASRPVAAETEAIERAILLAEATGCALHIVHVSSGEGAARVAEAQRRGVDVTCETCPHYLLFSEEDIERLGSLAKCAPPLRSRSERARLWQELMAGSVNFVASGHSPAPPAMKRGSNFFEVWAGIAGGQSTLPALLAAGYVEGRLSLPKIAELTAEAPARRFGLYPQKGTIQVGSDADLVLVDLSESWVMREKELLYPHPHSPYVGERMIGRVVRTIVRGVSVFIGGRVVSPPVGRMVFPRPGARDARTGAPATSDRSFAARLQPLTPPAALRASARNAAAAAPAPPGC